MGVLSPHLEIIHVFILQGASRWRCSRQRLLRMTTKTHGELRLVNSGQVTAAQKTMTDVTQLDIDGHGWGTAEMGTTRTGQFLKRDHNKGRLKLIFLSWQTKLKLCETVQITHQCRGAQQGSPSSLPNAPQAQLLQALRPRVHKGGGKRRIIGLHHQAAVETTGAWRSTGAICQLKVGHCVTDAQTGVWVQVNGGNLKDLIPETGSMKRLLYGERKRVRGWSGCLMMFCSWGLIMWQLLFGSDPLTPGDQGYVVLLCSEEIILGKTGSFFPISCWWRKVHLCT